MLIDQRPELAQATNAERTTTKEAPHEQTLPCPTPLTQLRLTKHPSPRPVNKQPGVVEEVLASEAAVVVVDAAAAEVTSEVVVEVRATQKTILPTAPVQLQLHLQRLRLLPPIQSRPSKKRLISKRM